MTSESATVIQMDDGRAPVVAAAAPPAPGATAAASSSYATAPTSSSAAEPAAAPRKTSTGGGGLPFLLRSGAGGFRRCLAVIDFLLRVAAFGPTLAAAISTGTADERLSVFTNFFQFHARFDDFPAFTFFLVANAVAAGYLVLSLPFSVVGILRPNKATGVRLLLLICDVVIMALLTAAAAAAAAIVYVAHSGNRRANWVPICFQFHGFCQRTSGSVVATFLAVLVFIVLILMAACAIRRRPS
ncbi:unnamed protein product [Miscanthus lutarioriparius]|uniref:CASP-like protein n=1 Tax=Miscanthus lutarioriparius TaxID=422564 RepID=A0A811PFV7_9POAL|nr:unnamed protein product [Miscanthus lutarioriparius]